MMCCTTVYHPGILLGSIQGNSKIVIDLLDRGASRYRYMRISCLATRCIFLLLLFLLISLLFVAIWLDVALLTAVVAGESGVILLLAFSRFDRGCFSRIKR